MESAEFLTVYDSRWFETEIFGSTESSTDSPPDSPTLASMYLQIQKQTPPPPPPAESFDRRLNRSTMIRSISDDVYSKPTFESGESDDSPDSVLAPPPKQQRKKSRFVGKSKKVERSKSLTSLEFEELKGFMDLGFVFSEEDKDYPRLVSILPGLQRLGKTEESPVPPPPPPARPYLSEAWKVKEEQERKKKIVSPVINWPVPMSNEVELKDSLKLWAHTVASTVRI